MTIKLSRLFFLPALPGLFFISYITHAQSFSWGNISFEGMGFVTGIASHPLDPDYIVARTDVGGNYRWDPEESRWIPLLDAFNAPGVAADAMSSSDPALLYSVVSGGMLLKSDDRGDSWSVMEGFRDIYVNANSRYYRWGGKRLAVDPNNRGKVLYYASERDGLWKSPDYGVSWRQITLEEVPAGKVGGIAFVAFDGTSGGSEKESKVVYAGVQGEGVFGTKDGGITWSRLWNYTAEEVDQKPVSGIVSSDGTLYVTTSAQENERHDGNEGRITRYRDGSITDITPSINNGLGFTGIDAAPEDPGKIIAMQWKPGLQNGIHLSSDGGETWKNISFANRDETPWFPNYTSHTWTSHIMFDRRDPGKVWKANGFGIYHTCNIHDDNPLWTTVMTGLEELVAGQVHVPPVNKGKAVFSLVMDKIAFSHDQIDKVPSRDVFGGLFGIGTGMDYCRSNPSLAVIVGSQMVDVSEPRHLFTSDNGISWEPIPAIPDGFNNGNIAISATNENLWVWAPHNEVTSLPNVQMHYTTDKGNTWQPSSGIPEIRNNATHTWSQSNFLAPDRVNGNLFYYYLLNENGALYRSNDGGHTFSKVFSGLPQYHRCRLKAVPFMEGHLFFHTEGGIILHSDDYGSTWREMTGISEVFGIGFGKSLTNAAEPAIYIAATIDEVQAVFLSGDYGKTWQNISKGNMPAGKVRDISGDLRTAGLVYFATRGRGVMYGIADMNTFER